MNSSIAEQHRAEVRKGLRFQFGKNWSKFLATLNDQKIEIAERSLQSRLACTSLNGKTFLDIGSGSGLFSLAARRLGARVRSFDYDPRSVACTRELCRRYFPADNHWTVEQGSALDRSYLESLGTFDIVYSWGVLHHTGEMWQALENVKRLTKLGGQLFIAIYNELGAVTDDWRKVKRRYNELPRPMRLPFALRVILRESKPIFIERWRRGEIRSYIREWTEYSVSARGMSRWHDWIDWIGGYPYESATIDAVVDFFGQDGFALETLESRATGIGCNEFVFRRRGELGTFIDNPLPASRVFSRRFGRRIASPFTLGSLGYTAKIPDQYGDCDSLILFRDGALIGKAERGDGQSAIVIAPSEWPQDRVDRARVEVVRARFVSFPSELQHHTGNMYGIALPNLAPLADHTSPGGEVSPLFVFENGRQLAFPHSLHADIVKYGGGRFSHWGGEMLFSSSDNSDPRTNGRSYQLLLGMDATNATGNEFQAADSLIHGLAKSGIPN
jgi:2-polyprenyl-6-hydroxyphenyl methylase/3-demethylubiquinone-9 3-methyltransferase